VRAPAVTFRVIVRSGVSWIWIGACLMGAGAFLALRLPRRGRARGGRLRQAVSR
jgi:cytochrome c-type biogenesis protein CcmF